MNKFERVSEAEYNKVVSDDRIAESGILSVQPYSDIKLPRRATSQSAGYDFCSPVSFKLKPGESIKIPTFIKAQLNYGSVLLLFPRSSYGFKYRMQLDNCVAIVDADFYDNESNEGNIFIQITNDSKTGKIMDVGIGERFAQGIIMNYEVTDDDDTLAVRIGGLGSTGV